MLGGKNMNIFNSIIDFFNITALAPEATILDFTVWFFSCLMAIWLFVLVIKIIFGTFVEVSKFLRW